MASSTATQQFIPIESIRDGVISLKNGELRAVLMTNSLNLSLKGEDEQQAIIMQFQSFLNSIEFPVQFFVESRRLNINPYIDLLKKRSFDVQEDLLKIQINEYMGFIRKFTEETNIMTKHFFVVVSYMSPILGTGQSGSSLLSFGGGKDTSASQVFEENRVQLEQRITTVSQGLLRFGIRSQKLNTEEAVELFYKLFNPGEQNHSAPKLMEDNK